MALDEDRFVGQALNVAARVAEQARAGQLLCTESVVQEMPAASGITFQALGHFTFQSHRYLFCSEECREAFVKRPEDYVEG